MNELAQIGKIPVLALQDCLLSMPQADIRTEHIFTPGRYERRITIPAWTVLTGAEHRTDYWVRLEQGTIAVTTDDGVKILAAPFGMAVKAGMQRAGRVFEDDVVWVDVYDNPDDCQNLAILEARLYVIPEIGLGSNRMAIEQAKADYQLFVKQMPLDESAIEALVRTDDLIEMPSEWAVEVRPSPIDGMGMFALKSFASGDMVCAGRLDNRRTPAGRFMNHSCHPNIKPVLINEDIYAVAVRPIFEGDELLVDYRASMRVNCGLVFSGEIPCLDG